MSSEKLQFSIMKLRESMHENDTVHDETRALTLNLEEQLQRISDSENPPENYDESIDLATSLEARFEAEHPTAAGFVREIINTLQKMGI